ncbi:MAG: putative beta-lysine N-acetyltransferase [Bacteroidales bacterium]
MQDRIETIGKGTIIQHGKFNDRIYLMKLHQEDCPGVLGELRQIARENAYTKIFCKVPGWAAPAFFSDGYLMEAQIPKFYKKKEAAFFLSKYLNSDRLLGVEHESLAELGKLLKTTIPGREPSGKTGIGGEIKKLDLSYVGEITSVYREVFLSYPFPIHDPEYITRTMKQNVQYYGIERKGNLMAVASSEIDTEGQYAEMTDFATLPDYRGNNLSVRLLSKMEEEMKKQGIHTLYTIARLNSAAMNRTFLKLQYSYAGTLIRNTNIAGKIESMNVYYKHI